MNIAYESRQYTKRKNILKPGFTFIELIIALAILAILAIVIVPNLTKYLTQAKETRTSETLNTLRLALSSYYADNNKYPNTLTDLVRKPNDVKKWRGPYLDMTDVPEDGWGSPFVYRVNPKGGARPYELYSESPEGIKYSVWEVGK